MKSSDLRTERRRFNRHKANKRPIAVLGPDPIRVGHITNISDEAAEIQFTERNGTSAATFSELVVLVPDFIHPYLSGRINVETISCSTAAPSLNNENLRMRKCVISLTHMDLINKRQLKNACL